VDAIRTRDVSPRVRLVLLSLAFLFAFPAGARARAVRHLALPDTPRSVLWIAAHPDDEAVAAPLLGQWCRDEQVRCGFLIVTRGEQGGCALPNGCAPDIATVRASEAAAASQLFDAELILLTLPDGGGAAPPQWPQAEESIAAYIEAYRPELILTFDPRHGTTCHPDHREVGRIVVDAMRNLSYAARLWLLETRVTITANAIEFTSATPHAERFDARASWSYVIEDMRRHPSQFPPELIALMERVPEEQRAVFAVAADFAVSVEMCP